MLFNYVDRTQDDVVEIDKSAIVHELLEALTNFGDVAARLRPLVRIHHPAQSFDG